MNRELWQALSFPNTGLGVGFRFTAEPLREARAQNYYETARGRLEGALRAKACCPYSQVYGLICYAKRGARHG